MVKKLSALMVGAVLLTAVPALAGHGKDKGKVHGKSKSMVVAVPPGHGGTPPGLAKKGGLPPGLAKKLGRPVPARIYVAFDPRRDDRAWFLIDDRWVLHRNFDPGLRLELRSLLDLPHTPRPPVRPPLGRLHIVLFG